MASIACIGCLARCRLITIPSTFAHQLISCDPLPQALLDCHVLDTPAERRYDAICRLLCSVFKVTEDS